MCKEIGHLLVKCKISSCPLQIPNADLVTLLLTQPFFKKLTNLTEP